MKKFVFIFILILLFTTSVYAEDNVDKITEGIENEMKDFEESLPDYIKDILPDELFKGDFSSLTNGEISTYTFFESIISFILADLPKILSTMSILLVIVIISSVFNTMALGINSEALKNTYSLCSTLCISVSVFGTVSSMLSSAVSYMKILCEIMNSFAPVLAVMHIMSGNISSAALGNATMLAFIALIENILLRILMPVVSVCLCFSLVKAISGNIEISGISKFIRGTFVTLTVFTMMIFSFVFSFQSTLTQSADSLSIKTAKFAIGNLYP